MSICSPARITILAIIALTAVCSVLSALALTAGHKKGFLENYDVLRINMTGLGKDIFDSSNGDSQDDDDGNPLSGILDDAKDGIKDIINDVTGNIIDEVTERMGISDWYSLHVMTACFGGFTPNASAPNPGLNTTGCRDTMPDNPFNITEMLDRELGVGPLNINLADINWPSDIQDMIDLINKLLLALFILYVLTFSLTTLSVLCAPVSWFKPDSRGLLLTNTTISVLAMICSLLSAIMITVIGTKGIDELNDKAGEIGINAQRGRGFLTMSWIVAGFMLGAAFGWLSLVVSRLRRRMRYGASKERY